jgi:uncharacterized protein YjbI with pentapeptide repeats
VEIIPHLSPQLNPLIRLSSQTLSNQTLSNQTLSNQTLSNQTLSNQTLSNQTLSNQISAPRLLQGHQSRRSPLFRHLPTRGLH